jgi:hypothetical protein
MYNVIACVIVVAFAVVLNVGLGGSCQTQAEQPDECYENSLYELNVCMHRGQESGHLDMAECRTTMDHVYELCVAAAATRRTQ